MADLIIKPLTGAGNTVRIQDQAGGSILTSADSGATIDGGVTIPAAGITGTLVDAVQDNITRLGSVTSIKLAPTASSSAPTGTQGAMYYDSDNNSLMIYDTAWRSTTFTGTATGGTESAYGGYKVHTYTTSSTFVVVGGTIKADILIVAGGGGGGTDPGSTGSGGGGGAGGLRYLTGQLLESGTYTVTIGAGGGTNQTLGGQASDGEQTDIVKSGFYDEFARGGGGGGNCNSASSGGAGRDGGSGGAGADNAPALGGSADGSSAGSDNMPGYWGNDGGDAHLDAADCGGGGGGAGQPGNTNDAGSQDNDVYGGYGGNGLQFDIRTGSDVYYSGGGGSGGDSGSNNGTKQNGTTGGRGGGGNSGSGYSSALDGTANSGGGGGTEGADGANSASGTGGSGIVVVRWHV